MDGDVASADVVAVGPVVVTGAAVGELDRSMVTRSSGRATVGMGSPSSRADTMMRWLALNFGWQAASVRRLSPKSPTTSVWSGVTIWVPATR